MEFKACCGNCIQLESDDKRPYCYINGSDTTIDNLNDSCRRFSNDSTKMFPSNPLIAQLDHDKLPKAILIALLRGDHRWKPEDVAKHAVSIADALINELNKE